jgi:chemotaxis protein CheX
MSTAYCEVMEQVAQMVFSTMLDIELTRMDEPAPRDLHGLLANVHLAGQWTGSVTLELAAPVAHGAAASMLQMDRHEVTEDDQREVAAELVNMIGGNLKSVLPGPSFLSLPTMISGRDLNLQIRDALLTDDVVLRCSTGLLRLRLYEKLSVSSPREDRKLFSPQLL